MLLQTFIALVSFVIQAAYGNYVSYPRPSIYNKSAHFSLKVNGTDMYTVSYAGYDYVQLSMDRNQATEFRIRVTDKTSITSYTISPRRYNIHATIDGDQLVFTLPEPYYLIVKIDDEKEFVILADPTETNIPNPSASNVYNVLDYNADNTGSSVTHGIQNAMDAAGAHPGSTVYVPAGLYLMGNLIIRDQTSLYLAGGAVLRFTGNSADYTTLFTKSDIGPGTWWIRTEANSTNINVYGRGTIDGNGFNSLAKKFIASMLVPVGTTNFNLDGVLIRDSSFWAVTPIQVENALITNLKVLNRHDVGQNDAIDIIESTGVSVRRAIGISLDDSFSTKTWPYNQGTTVPYPYSPRPLQDVLFYDCLAWTDCYGYKVGQGVYESQDNVTFQNSVVYTAAVGIGIDHKSGSMTASNIIFDNIDIESLHGSNAGHASWLAAFIESAGQGVGPVEDVFVTNVRARKLGTAAGLLQGYNASAMMTRVTLSNVYVGESTTPATTLQQMNLLNTSYSQDIKIVNT